MNKVLNNIDIHVAFSQHQNHTDNLISKESLHASLGKIARWKHDFHPVVWTGNATTVDGHTVKIDVPSDAKFTDTIYTLPPATSETLGGIVVGDGLAIDDDGMLSVDFPKQTPYKAGSGISIGETHGTSINSDQYEALEYLQFNGQTVFDTGVVHQKHDTFEVDVQFIERSSGDLILFDSRIYANQANTYSVWINLNGTVGYGRTASATSTSQPISYDKVYRIITHNEICDIYNVETDTLFEQLQLENAPIDDGLYTMAIGNVHNRDGMTHSQNFGWFKLYRFRWYRDDVLIHDYIPARNVDTLVLGLYDSVTDRFITPYQVGNLSAGDVASDVIQSDHYEITNTGVLDVIKVPDGSLGIVKAGSTKYIELPSEAPVYTSGTGIDITSDDENVSVISNTGVTNVAYVSEGVISVTKQGITTQIPVGTSYDDSALVDLITEMQSTISSLQSELNTLKNQAVLSDDIRYIRRMSSEQYATTTHSLNTMYLINESFSVDTTTLTTDFVTALKSIDSPNYIMGDLQEVTE